MIEDRQSHDPWAPPPPAQSLTGVVIPMVDQDVETTEQDADVWPDLDETEPSETGNDPADLIPADLDDITLKDLKALAELAGVATYGSKADVADRIRAA